MKKKYLSGIRSKPSLLLTLASFSLCQQGCDAPQMVADFSVAERVAAQQNKDIFIFYKSWLSAECGVLQDTINQPQVQSALAGKVVCILDHGYEPNQRYVAQYGIDRFPAIIVIHRDNTYHAQIGNLSADQMANFLQLAQSPGQTPQINEQIPRSVDYQWQVEYATALQMAQKQNRSLFIFYKSVVNPDCNEVLWNVLNRSDVATHFNDTVNCRLDWGHPPNRSFVLQYGITDVPGFLVIHPDGTYAARQGRLTAEQLIHFIEQAKAKK